MRIAVTDNMGAEKKLQLYMDWLKSGNPDLEFEIISYTTDTLSKVDACDGVLLTGGGDVDPLLYGSGTIHPKTHGVDRQRDTFEQQVIDAALLKGKPLLGICRGIQIINVHFGGTLLQDLDELGYTLHTSNNEHERRHTILVQPGGILWGAVGAYSGSVNTYHHQAVDVLGRGLQVSARSEDGIIEAIELENGTSKSFLLALQWHPERMTDGYNPFNRNILETFLISLQQKIIAI